METIRVFRNGWIIGKGSYEKLPWEVKKVTFGVLWIGYGSRYRKNEYKENSFIIYII